VEEFGQEVGRKGMKVVEKGEKGSKVGI